MKGQGFTPTFCAIAWGSVGASMPADGPTNYVVALRHRVGWALPPVAPAWGRLISFPAVLSPGGVVAFRILALCLILVSCSIVLMIG